MTEKQGIGIYSSFNTTGILHIKENPWGYGYV